MVKNPLWGVERHTTIAIQVGISVIKQQGKDVQRYKILLKLMHTAQHVTLSKAEDNTLRVEVHTTHKSQGHLRLTHSEHAAIAGQLAQGVDFQHILDNIRDSLGTEFKRIHLLTRKDITNIAKAYGLKVAQRHADDATSVNMWVTEMMSQEGNPIILYKQQGEPQSPEYNNLCKEDFVLALQTPLQANMMKKHANGRVSCTDSTHRMNGYDFILISVLIVDEYGKDFL